MSPFLTCPFLTLESLFFPYTAIALEKQQVPDSEQTSACAAGEERHEGDFGLGWQRGLLVLHSALLQAALPGRQRE